jgi:hypothetical protein
MCTYNASEASFDFSSVIQCSIFLCQEMFSITHNQVLVYLSIFTFKIATMALEWLGGI